jgi:hypothetical protein
LGYGVGISCVAAPLTVTRERKVSGEERKCGEEERKEEKDADRWGQSTVRERKRKGEWRGGFE